MQVPDLVRVLRERPGDVLLAKWTLQHAAVDFAGAGTGVRLVAAVVKAVDVVAAVAREGQEVLLVAAAEEAVRADVHGDQRMGRQRSNRSASRVIARTKLRAEEIAQSLGLRAHRYLN